jgi:hypothetical protein
MSHRPNVYTSPNASGLVRAALESGRDRGDSATPTPTMPSRPIQQRGPVMNSDNNSQSGFANDPFMSQQSLRSRGSGSPSSQSQGGAPINRPNFVRPGDSQNPQNQGRQGTSNYGSTIHPNTSQNSLRSGASQNQATPVNNNQPRFANNPNPNQQFGFSQNQRALLHNRNDSSSSGSSGNSSQGFNSGNTNPAVSMSFGRPPQQPRGRGSMKTPHVRPIH